MKLTTTLTVLLVLLVLLVMVFLTVGFFGCSEDQESASLDSSTISSADQKVIEESISVFIKSQYQAKVDRDPNELQQALTKIVASPEQAELIAKVAESITYGAALDDKPYKSFQTELIFNHEKDRFVKDRAQIGVTESTKLGFGLSTGDFNSAFVFEHLIFLERQSKDWKIVDDRILNLPDSPPYDPQDSLSFMEGTARAPQPEQNLAPAGTTYQRANAVAYARKWALGSNPIYRNWISSNADCTNYLSQSVRAGGWPMTDGYWFPWLSCYWWYTPTGQTNTWTIANDFLVFTMGTGRGFTDREVNLRDGDMVSIDYEPDGKYNHHMFVTGKDSSGLLLSGHTRARLDFPLNGPPKPDSNVKYAVWVEQNHPKAIFCYVRLRDTF